MDLEKFEQIKKTHLNHWAESLEAGDRCKATIRHKTDGSKNRHNVEIIVVSNIQSELRIIGWDKHKPERTFSIPYNGLYEL